MFFSKTSQFLVCIEFFVNGFLEFSILCSQVCSFNSKLFYFRSDRFLKTKSYLRLHLKGEFTNFNIVISNDAPRQYCNILEWLRIWSPLTGVIVSLDAPKATVLNVLTESIFTLKTRLLLSGDSKSLALLGYCYTIEGHHLILHCQNW